MHELLQPQDSTLRAIRFMSDEYRRLAARAVLPVVDMVQSEGFGQSVAKAYSDLARVLFSSASANASLVWIESTKAKLAHLAEEQARATLVATDFQRSILVHEHGHELFISAARAARQVATELEFTPFRHRPLLAAQLEGVLDPVERLRIIREFNRLFRVCSPNENKRKQKGDSKPPPVAYVHKLINGLVKVLFAPLKINLDTLHPTKTLA